SGSGMRATGDFMKERSRQGSLRQTAVDHGFQHRQWLMQAIGSGEASALPRVHTPLALNMG
ncbi:hypothetical protein, partial [Acinetobacter baumannii]|uniref:hypothetical protein n=1 Tax=Acinetobacter baumannii TaxID=470 RepID=UPI001EF0E83A